MAAVKNFPIDQTYGLCGYACVSCDCSSYHILILIRCMCLCFLGVGVGAKVVLLPRNKADANAENHKKLVQAVKRGASGGGPVIMGSLLKESFEG